MTHLQMERDFSIDEPESSPARQSAVRRTSVAGVLNLVCSLLFFGLIYLVPDNVVKAQKLESQLDILRFVAFVAALFGVFYLVGALSIRKSNPPWESFLKGFYLLNILLDMALLGLHLWNDAQVGHPSAIGGYAGVLASIWYFFKAGSRITAAQEETARQRTPSF